MQDAPYLLRKAEIETMQRVTNTHFLNPQAKRLVTSLGDATGLTGLGVHIFEVAPGYQTTEFHFHHFEDEAVYVLSGMAAATIGDQDHAIAAGDFVGYRKGGLAHTITNTGDVPLRCLVIGQRLAHDVVDYPRKATRLHSHDGLPAQVTDLSGRES